MELQLTAADREDLERLVRATIDRGLSHVVRFWAARVGRLVVIEPEFGQDGR
jgi:hypothetical protein